MNEKRRRASAEPKLTEKRSMKGFGKPKLTEKRRNSFNEDGNEDDIEDDLSSFYSPPSQGGVGGGSILFLLDALHRIGVGGVPALEDDGEEGSEGGDEDGEGINPPR